MSDGIYIPSNTYIGYNIHIFICRVLDVPETELSKQSSQELIYSPEKSKTFCLIQHPVIQMIKVLRLYNLERLDDSKDGQHLRNSNSLTLILTPVIQVIQVIQTSFTCIKSDILSLYYNTSFHKSFNYMFHVHVQCFNSTTWFISMYYIYLLHVYTDKL